MLFISFTLFPSAIIFPAPQFRAVQAQSLFSFSFSLAKLWMRSAFIFGPLFRPIFLKLWRCPCYSYMNYGA